MIITWLLRNSLTGTIWMSRMVQLRLMSLLLFRRIGLVLYYVNTNYNRIRVALVILIETSCDNFRFMVLHIACNPCQPPLWCPSRINVGSHFTNGFAIAIEVRSKISFCSHLDSNAEIGTKFFAWYDSCAVVACVNTCYDLMDSNWTTARWNSNRIWKAS